MLGTLGITGTVSSDQVSECARKYARRKLCRRCAVTSAERKGSAAIMDMKRTIVNSSAEGGGILIAAGRWLERLAI
jgi:hypothetical protein